MRIKTRGYIYVGHSKIPRPLLSKKELLETQKRWLHNPKAFKEAKESGEAWY